VDASPSFIFMVDARARVVFANRSIARYCRAARVE
jgi:hypothetical protein